MSKTRTIENPEKMYKVLDGLKSPIQEGFEYEVGEEYHCENFNSNPEKDHAEEFYATELEGLPYAWNTSRNMYEVEVWGKAVEIDEYKRRYENIRIIKELDPVDVAEEAKEIEQEIGYRLSEVIQPVNPAQIEPPEIKDEHIQMLEEWRSVCKSVWGSAWHSVWDSVRDSVWDSVWGSVWGSVWDSAWDSVWHSEWDSGWDSVRGSVRGSVYAYAGSLFFEVEDWKGIEHKPGEYPFQPAIDLWRQGLVPSFDWDTRRLHGGEDMDVLWEGNIDE